MDIKQTRGFGPGFRPREGGDRRMYNPDRDIAYIMPQLMQLTTNSFYEEGPARDELRRLCWVWSNGPTDPPSLKEAAIDRGLEVFARMCECIGMKFCTEFMRGRRTFDEALEASGLNGFPPAMVDLWFRHFGHTVMSAFYYGCRDTLFPGEVDITDYRTIFDTAEILCEKLKGARG